jgi:O-6-methylguanine DNA methyltransferase
MKNNGFREKVYQLTRNIPKGRVVTYGLLAKMAGHPGAARAVGMFMRTNPDAPRTPCHRVVGFDGSLHGYSGIGGLATKKKMLTEEGVAFSDDKVNLEKSLWKPL